MKVNPIYTALPFYEVLLTYDANSSSGAKPFYFQKRQCKRDCFFGTITNRNHLPSFIIRIPKSDDPLYQLKHSTSLGFELVCPDGSNPVTIVPDYFNEIIAFIVPSDLPLIEAATPTLGDLYWLDDGEDVFLYEWGGASWIISLPAIPDGGELINVTNDGFVYEWVPEDLGFKNPLKNGTWVRTYNGFRLCDIGDYTYLIYNGFPVEDLPCGLHQIRITPGFPETFESTMWLSELVDIRDFDPDNNEYHKLTITNDCNLGNIPYADTSFTQKYYFEEDLIIGEPDYETKEEREEDGLGNEKLTFSQVTKFFTLDTNWIPEYIVDFLYFATQHNSIFITFPFEADNSSVVHSQYKGMREVDSDNFTAETDWIDAGCYAQVTMKLSLVDDVVRTACCQALDKDGCLIPFAEVGQIVCYDEQEDIEAIPPSIGDSFLIKPLSECPVCDADCNEWHEHPDEVATWNGSGWDYTAPVESLFIDYTNPSAPNIYFYSALDGWKVLNSVEQTGVTASSISVKGFIPQGTSGYLYYKTAGSFSWTLFGIFTQAELSSGVTITGLVSEENYEIRLQSLSNNCEYDFGPTLETGTPALF